MKGKAVYISSVRKLSHISPPVSAGNHTSRGWPYFRFPLGFCDVVEMLAERSVDIRVDMPTPRSDDGRLRIRPLINAISTAPGTVRGNFFLLITAWIHAI
jgi:hypothetical protein